MRNLLRRSFARNRWFLVAVSVLLGGFQFLLCAIVSSINIEGALETIKAFAPPVMSAVVEQAMGGSSSGVLAFGWNHPITHAVLIAIAITLAARAVAGEVESGAIELVLAQPLSRRRYLAAQVVFGMLSIGAVALVGIAGTLLGESVFGVHAFGPGRLLQVWLNIVLLQGAIFGITLLLSSFGREAGRVAILGVLLAVLSYLINVIAALWPKAAFLMPYSLHSYYDTRKILVDGVLAGGHIALLFGVAFGTIAAAFARLQTRDLP